MLYDDTMSFKSIFYRITAEIITIQSNWILIGMELGTSVIIVKQYKMLIKVIMIMMKREMCVITMMIMMAFVSYVFFKYLNALY